MLDSTISLATPRPGRPKPPSGILSFLSSEGRDACLLEDNSPAVIKRFGAFLVNVAKHNVASANSRLASVRTIFAAAVSEQHLAKNPATKIRLKDRSAESQEEIEIHQPYTKAHVYAGIERGIAPGCCPEMAVFHLISCDLGARGGDVFALDRSMFHRSPELQKNYFKYYARKAKKWHKVYPLDPTALLIQEYLDYHLFDKSERALFFPTFGQHTGPEVPDADFNCGSANAITYFGLFLDALKIRVLLASESHGRDRYSHSSHSGRVSCITMSAQAGMAESVTRARVLHKGAQVHRLYQKHSPEAVQRAVSGGYNEEGLSTSPWTNSKPLWRMPPNACVPCEASLISTMARRLWGTRPIAPLSSRLRSWPLPAPPDPRPCGAGSNRCHPGGSFHGCERKIVFLTGTNPLAPSLLVTYDK